MTQTDAADQLEGGSALSYHIILEDHSHVAAIDLLHEVAFGPGRFARAAYRVREQGDYDHALSFVAIDRTHHGLLGSVRLTWIETTKSKSRGLLLGPLAVNAEARGRGIGRALVSKCIDAGTATDAAYLMLVGDQPYYGPLGFEIAPLGQVHMPAPVDRKRLLVHAYAHVGFDAATLSGVVRHADLSTRAFSLFSES